MQRKTKSRKSWGSVTPAQFPHSPKQGKGVDRKEGRRIEREAVRG
jgi:hypothetical protein